MVTKKATKAAPKATKKAPMAKPAANSMKLSQMDAAVAVLKQANAPMNCKGMVRYVVQDEHELPQVHGIIQPCVPEMRHDF